MIRTPTTFMIYQQELEKEGRKAVDVSFSISSEAQPL